MAPSAGDRTSAAFDALIANADAWLRARQETLARTYGVGAEGRFHVDLAAGTIRFVDPAGRARASARVVVAGTWTVEARSFLWGIDNPSLPTHVTGALEAVRAHGERSAMPALGPGAHPCEEDTAWSLAAVAGFLLEADGLYVAPQPRVRAYLLLFDLTHGEGGEPAKSAKTKRAKTRVAAAKTKPKSAKTNPKSAKTNPKPAKTNPKPAKAMATAAKTKRAKTKAAAAKTTPSKT